MQRASRALSGEFGNLGFYDPFLWIAWVVRWRDVWPGFDLLICFRSSLAVVSIGGKERNGGDQSTEFTGFLLVVDLVPNLRFEVLRPCSTTSYWKPYVWEFFAKAPLFLFNVGSWVDCVVLLDSLLDRVCSFSGLVYLGKKLPLSNPIEFRALWHLGVGFTLRFALLVNSVIAINYLRIYFVCLSLFSIIFFLV